MTPSPNRKCRAPEGRLLIEILQRIGRLLHTKQSSCSMYFCSPFMKEGTRARAHSRGWLRVMKLGVTIGPLVVVVFAARDRAARRVSQPTRLACETREEAGFAVLGQAKRSTATHGTLPNQTFAYRAPIKHQRRSVAKLLCR